MGPNRNPSALAPLVVGPLHHLGVAYLVNLRISIDLYFVDRAVMRLWMLIRWVCTRLQYIGPGGVRTKIQFRIECEKFECVVVVRSWGVGSWSHIAGSSSNAFSLVADNGITRRGMLSLCTARKMALIPAAPFPRFFVRNARDPVRAGPGMLPE
jgi:hypothetical protein